MNKKTEIQLLEKHQLLQDYCLIIVEMKDN